MKGIILLLFLHLSGSLAAFTLTSDPPTRFGSSEIAITASGNTCANIGFTPSELIDVAMEAADRFWNRVPTSRLKIKRGDSVPSVDSAHDTDTELAAKASVNTIIIGCSDGDNFTAPNPFASASIIGGGYVHQDSSGTRGAILINDNVQSTVDSLSREKLITLLGHEMGHALGLHHSSDKAALMYYSIVADHPYLARDDAEGITYLYPREKKLGGLAAACGTIKSDGSNLPLLLSFLVGLIFALFAFSFFEAVWKSERKTGH